MTYGVETAYISTFFLVMIRVGAMFYLAPFFSTHSVPDRVKLGLAIFVTLVLLPVETKSLPEMQLGFDFFVAGFREAMLGLMLGYAVSLVFQAIEMAAAVVGVQIGFGLAEVVDPINGSRSSTMHQFYNVTATLIFLGLNGHHLVIQGLLDSFRTVPVGSFDPTAMDLDLFIAYVAGAIELAMRIAIPVVASVLFTDVALAVASKTMPQLNVMSISFPLKIAGGLLILALSLPYTMQLATDSFGGIPGIVNGLLPSAQG